MDGLKLQLFHHFPPDQDIHKALAAISSALTSVINSQAIIIQNQENLMTQFDDMKAQVTELRKDMTRVIAALGDSRQALADANAKIDVLLKTDNLSPASQQTLNEIQAILVDADNEAEAAAPEAPAPSPPVELTPPADQGTPAAPTDSGAPAGG